MNNRLIQNLNRASILILAVLLIWSFWPLPKNNQVMQINQSYIDAEQLEQCPSLARLLEYEFELLYPEKIWRSEENQISLALNRPLTQASMVENDRESNLCNLTLEVKLDIDNLLVSPGDRIIDPFTGQDSQTFNFNITPYGSGVAEGELWISADIYDGSGIYQTHVPLFVIPLEIEIVSIIGLPPTIVRYICLFALMIQFVIAFRKRLFGEQCYNLRL